MNPACRSISVCLISALPLVFLSAADDKRDGKKTSEVRIDGKFDRLDTDKSLIYVEKDGKIVSYKYVKEIAVLDGDDEADLEDLEKGDKIRLICTAVSMTGVKILIDPPDEPETKTAAKDSDKKTKVDDSKPMPPAKAKAKKPGKKKAQLRRNKPRRPRIPMPPPQLRAQRK